VVLRRGINGGELGRQVGQVGEGELAGVGGVADAQEDYGVLDEIALGCGC
jgi:hypothetical protein